VRVYFQLVPSNKLCMFYRVRLLLKSDNALVRLALLREELLAFRVPGLCFAAVFGECKLRVVGAAQGGLEAIHLCVGVVQGLVLRDVLAAGALLLQEGRSLGVHGVVKLGSVLDEQVPNIAGKLCNGAQGRRRLLRRSDGGVITLLAFCLFRWSLLRCDSKRARSLAASVLTRRRAGDFGRGGFFHCALQENDERQLVRNSLTSCLRIARVTFPLPPSLPILSFLQTFFIDFARISNIMGGGGGGGSTGGPLFIWRAFPLALERLFGPLLSNLRPMVRAP
jgi:hypothetical protein